MATAIRILIGDWEIKGELNDGPAGRALAAALPLKWEAELWGNEFYGSLDKDVASAPGPMQEKMAVGDLAWHAPNGWFCLFFGPTPLSRGPEPMAAVPVQPVGRVSGDWGELKARGPRITALIQAA